MAVYKDKYEEYLNDVQVDINQCFKSGKQITFGYTSDLDVLIEWNVDIFNRILKSYLKEEPSVKEGETIDSLEDFARIVSYYAIHGLGGEIDISNSLVCDYLEENFKTSFSLGGTCAQGAAALCAMGFPVTAHITDKSKEVCELMNYPTMRMISDNELIPIEDGANDETPIKHIIFQYAKGDIILIDGDEYVIPLTNRLIMDYDLVHKFLPIEKDYLNYLEKHTNQFYAYSISGFNGIIDIDILKARMEKLREHYATVKDCNPNCILYLESAHYLNGESRNYVFHTLAPYIDILGMNEEELVDLGQRFGESIHKEDLQSVIHGLELIMSQYPVKGIVMHTKDYSMYYGCELVGVDLEKGLTLGNLMSGTRARAGIYGNPEDCRESLKNELSTVGLAFKEELDNLKTKRFAVLVPSRYMEFPKCTIGLGDTFVAGMQICFIH